MSLENVELVGRLYGAWNRGDMVALADVFDPEVEVRLPPAVLGIDHLPGPRGHRCLVRGDQRALAALRAEPHRCWMPGSAR